MGKLAFLFAGQGAQCPGMGQALYQAGGAARQVFEAAEAARPGLMSLCFAGTAGELQQTVNTQPAVYTVDLAAAAALSEKGVEPDGVLGFSLGELAALQFAGAFDAATGMALVLGRAALMQAAAEAVPGCMAAVLRLADEDVEAVCQQFEQVYPVNYNADGQLVVAGAVGEMDVFEQAVAGIGGRARRLAVGGGFHSPMMAGAAEAFAQKVAEAATQPPALPVWANATARPYAGSIAAMLGRQMQSPVLFKQSVAAMAAAGYDTFVEVGPGKTLTGLVKRILPEAATFSVQTPEDAAAVAAALLA